MDPKTYVHGVLETESCNMNSILSRCSENNMRLLHAGLGMATEAGEFLDAIKKYLFYNKPLDKVNLLEEMGDLFWYMGVASDVLQVSFEEIMQINNNKLASRYSKGFSEKEAQHRNLDKEREILEDKK